MLAAASKERARQSSEHHSAARLLRREAAEVAVDHEGGIVTTEAATAGLRWDEHLGRNDPRFHQANNRQNHCLCQAPCFLTLLGAMAGERTSNAPPRRMRPARRRRCEPARRLTRADGHAA